MASKPNVAEFTLSLKENKYKGEVYHQLVGSFKTSKESFLVSISCDESGVIKLYESQKGTEFCYARAVKFSANGEKPKRRNEMR